MIVHLPLAESDTVTLHCWNTGFTGTPDPITRREVVENGKNQLIRKAFGREITVESLDSGKPKPVGNTFISFSHSRELIVLACSPCNVGIDLQYYSDKLLRVSGKFVSAEEELMLNDNPVSRSAQIHFLWCAKEAIFKLYGTEVPFKEIVAADLNLDVQGSISFRVKNQADHVVRYCFFEDFCFCIAL